MLFTLKVCVAGGAACAPRANGGPTCNTSDGEIISGAGGSRAAQRASIGG